MRNPLDGCSDGYCKITGPAKGMHTNGGCRCLRMPEDQKAFQDALAIFKDEYYEAMEIINIAKSGNMEKLKYAIEEFDRKRRPSN